MYFYMNKDLTQDSSEVEDKIRFHLKTEGKFLIDNWS